MFNCEKHHWESPNHECLHCVSEAGGKIELVSWKVGSHGHLLYSVNKKIESYTIESCSLKSGWQRKTCGG